MKNIQISSKVFFLVIFVVAFNKITFLGTLGFWTSFTKSLSWDEIVFGFSFILLFIVAI